MWCRNVQYGFKFWLAASIALTITLTISSNFPDTRAWRLYYGYITTVIIMIEKVVSCSSLHICFFTSLISCDKSVAPYIKPILICFRAYDMYSCESIMLI